MADSPLPAVALSPCDVEEKKGVTVAAVSSPASPPFGLRAAVAAAIATFPERRRGLKDVSNSLAPAKSPAQKPQPSPSPVRAVSTLRRTVGSTSEFSETGSDTPLHTERAVEPTTPKTPVASPAAPLLMTPPPRSPKLDAPFSELGKFPELAPAPPAPARRVPVTLAALVAFVALGAAVVVTAPPPVAPVVPVAAPVVTRKAIVLRAQTAALKPVPKVKPATKPAAKPAAPKAPAPKTKAPKAKAPAPKAKKPAPAAAKQPRKGPLARALAPAHALVKAILALALPVKVAFCAAAAALAILA